MTVSYTKEVATISDSTGFLRLLFRWNGSVYKLVWKEFAIFAVLYYLLAFIYRFGLRGNAKIWFESVAEYCQDFGDLIPVAFVLGFYVSLVVSRFWEQFKSIPWPSRMALFVSSLVQGNDDTGHVMRCSIMRYLCLANVLTMSSISPPVKKRFPSLQDITDAGFLSPNEQAILERMQKNTTSNIYFVPLVWAANLVARARKLGRIKDDFAVKTLIDEINDYRGKCGSIFGYDWVTVPLVYTQVVTIAVYTFFLSCLMGRQFLENGNIGDMYFPVFTFLQFLFYMGWLKVAETLLNPFGEDDEDFDMVKLIDSNLKSAYLIVDEMHAEHPELIEDQYWDTVAIELPYTPASLQFQKTEHLGSAVGIKIPHKQSQFVVSSSVPKGNSMPRIPEEGEEEGGEGKKLLSESGPKCSTSEDQTGRKTSQSNLSRSTSRIGSLRNIFFRSLSFLSKNRPIEEDVESGTAAAASQESSSKDMMELKAKCNQPRSRNHKENLQEDMIFEMSDVESVSSKHSAEVVASDETKSAAKHPTQKTTNENPVAQSYRSSTVTSVTSDTSKLEDHLQFVEEVRDKLKELRETKEPVKDPSSVKV